MIPIPRVGVYWGVEAKLPQTDGEYWIEVGDATIAFDSEEQALISIWLMGFSYAQMLILFPRFKDVQSLRNFIFPRSLGAAIELRVKLNGAAPRQLVDSEYVAIVREVGIPKGKIGKDVYKRYMEWVKHDGKVFWLNDKEKVNCGGVKKLEEKRQKLMAQMEKKQVEIENITRKINLCNGEDW